MFIVCIKIKIFDNNNIMRMIFNRIQILYDVHSRRLHIISKSVYFVLE